MKKMFFLLAIICSIATVQVQAQNKMPTVEDAIAAIQKGIIVKPTPKVLALGKSLPIYELVKDYVVYYKYKGVFYVVIPREDNYRLFGYDNIAALAVTPNGEELGPLFFNLPDAP